MKRILFVDDEPQVLEGLRGVLRKQRKKWEMVFVTSGEEALQELLAAHFDVIVSDMRMPHMDGATLLRLVQQDHPHMVRIVLSGHTEYEVSRRLVHVAHQFIAKPFDGRELQQVIERACSLQRFLEQPELRRVVGQIGQLPIAPLVYTRLVQVLSHRSSSINDAAAVVEGDVGIAAKVLQVVNSAFFGSRRRVTDIKTAISYLGVEIVKVLALSMEIQQLQGEVVPCPGFNLAAVQAHGLLSARIARRLLLDELQAQDAFAAAVLQDIGLLVLSSRLPEVFRGLVEQAQRGQRILEEVELEVLGVTHAQIGAYLLGIWGLPYPIVEAVAYHHHPSAAPAGGAVEVVTLDVVGAVHVASVLAEELDPSPLAGYLRSGCRLDDVYLSRLGFMPRVDAWRALAQAEVALTSGASLTSEGLPAES